MSVGREKTLTGVYLLSVFLFNYAQPKDISGCCTRIQIQSSGEAINHQSNRIGEYSLHGVLADRPIYRNVEREEYLFYLMSRNKGLWMVGPKAGQFNGGLAHRGDTLCVEDVAQEQWKYTDGSAWHVDPLLTVSCLTARSPPECTYNDGVQFVGGDLPAEFGGGGIETNMNSSSECIEECEKREGCQYWTWVQQEGANCFLKVDRIESVRRPKYVSGSIPSACVPSQESSAQGESVCTYEGIDFVGGDLFSIPALSVDDCRQQCEDQVACKLFSYVAEEDIGCYLKTEAVKAQVADEVVSGAIFDICEEFVLPHSASEVESNEVYNANEIHGSFRIMMDFKEELNNRESQEFKDLSGALEKYLLNMLENEPELSEQATFDVRVVDFKPGSVICNFKVNYVLKEVYLAIPFAIKPSNITDAMNKNFKFKKGILFQRFLIAAGSFKSSTPVDHCEAKGCSHKCDYNYDQQEYVCTCPPDLVLNTDDKTCVGPEDVNEVDVSGETEIGTTGRPEVTVTLLPTDCLWSAWSEWAPCSCDTGKTERTREIAIPAKNGGICSGRYKEVEDCETALCNESEGTTLKSMEVFESVTEEALKENESEMTVSTVVNDESSTVDSTTVEDEILDDDVDEYDTVTEDSELEVTVATVMDDAQTNAPAIEEDTTGENTPTTTEVSAAGETGDSLTTEPNTEEQEQDTTEIFTTEEPELKIATTTTSNIDMADTNAPDIDESETEKSQTTEGSDSTEAFTDRTENDVAVTDASVVDPDYTENAGNDVAVTEPELETSTTEAPMIDISTMKAEVLDEIVTERTDSDIAEIEEVGTEEPVSDVEDITTTANPSDSDASSFGTISTEQSNTASIVESTTDDVSSLADPVTVESISENDISTDAADTDSEVEENLTTTEAYEGNFGDKIITVTEAAERDSTDTESDNTYDDDVDGEQIVTEASADSRTTSSPDDYQDEQSNTVVESEVETTTASQEATTSVVEILNETSTESDDSAAVVEESNEGTTQLPSENDQDMTQTTTEVSLDESQMTTKESDSSTLSAEAPTTMSPEGLSNDFATGETTVGGDSTETAITTEASPAEDQSGSTEQAAEIDESLVTETLDEESDSKDLATTEPLGQSQQETTTASIPSDAASFDEQEATTTISNNEQKESEEATTQTEEETKDVTDRPMDQQEVTENQLPEAEGKTTDATDNDVIIFPDDEEDRVFSTTLRSITEDENLGFPTESIEPLEEVTEMSQEETTTVTIIEATEADKDLPEILSQTKDEMAEDNAISDTPRSFPDSETFVQNEFDDADKTDEAAPIESVETTTTKLTSETDATTEAIDDTTVSVTEDKTEHSEGDSTVGETTESDAEVEEPTTVSTAGEPVTKLFQEESTATTTESVTANVPTEVTVIAVEELDDDSMVVVTTARPAVTDAPTVIIAEDDAGVHEFDCVEVGQEQVATAEGQIPMECTQMDGEERKHIYLVINKNQVDPELLFAKNVKVVVKDFMVMDIPTPDSSLVR